MHAPLRPLTRIPVLPDLPGRDLSERNSSERQLTNGQQDLQFVNLPNNLKLDVAARRRVRSHVARDFRRRAKVPGISSLAVDLDVVKRVTRQGAPGQKHRFRFGKHGLQETGKQSSRKSATRKVSSVWQDRLPAQSPIIRSANATEDPGGPSMPGFSSLQIPLATEEFVPDLLVDTPYSSSSTGDEPYSASHQLDASSQCCTTPQKSTGRLGNSQLVRWAKPGHDHPHVRKPHLATTGTGNLDPFNTMPIVDRSCRTQILMHHCKHFIPVPLDTLWAFLTTGVIKCSPSKNNGLTVNDASPKGMVLSSNTRSRALSCRPFPRSWEPWPAPEER